MPEKKAPSKLAKPQCGLCGKSGKLVKTECCGHWVCDDEDTYVPFSYARNSCHRNHRRFTLCGSHFAEGHKGDWKTCAECGDGFEVEMYVWYGTNEHNFERLQNPPAFAPTRCAGCGTHISLPLDGYTSQGDKYWCMQCASRQWRSEGMAEPKKPPKTRPPGDR